VLLADLESLDPAIRDVVLDRLADVLAPRIAERLAATDGSEPDGWLNSKDAASYLGITPNAVHKLTAERAIPFEQEAPGCKCWFKRSDLDAWRRGSQAKHLDIVRTSASKSLPNGQIVNVYPKPRIRQHG
jgi:hypothetical protein